jgi:acyl carrier protein
MNGNAESILRMFREKLNVEIADPDADLISDGLMDSLMLVELLTYLEQEYQITIDFMDLEVENFRSIASITQFVESRVPA